VLPDFSGCRIHHDQLVRQAGGHDQFAVGTQRQNQWSHAGKSDESADGRDPLIDRCLQAAGAAANNFSRRIEIVQSSGRSCHRQGTGSQQAGDGRSQFHFRLK